MLQGVHTRKISIPVEAPVGDTVIVPRNTSIESWLYVHALTGDMDADGTLSVVAINPDDSSETVLATFDLDEGQGLNLSDEPGEDNRPRFEFTPLQDYVLRVTGGTFTGGTHYSFGN